MALYRNLGYRLNCDDIVRGSGQRRLCGRCGGTGVTSDGYTCETCAGSGKHNYVNALTVYVIAFVSTAVALYVGYWIWQLIQTFIR